MKRYALIVVLLTYPASADPARIVEARATAMAENWHFDVTLCHGDTGWDDYADGRRIELPDGTVLGTRILLHPHVTEQPFTRSLSGVAVPEGTETLHIRARTSQTGWAAATTRVSLD